MALAVLGDQFRGRAASDDLPMVHDRDVVCELFRLVEIVGRQEDRRTFFLELPNEGPQLPSRAWVESRRRLIEEDERRTSDKGHRDPEPPLLASGEVHGEGLRPVCQPDRPDDVVDLLLRHRSVEQLGPIGDGLPRLQPVEGFKILWQDADAVPDFAVVRPDVHAEHAGLPRGRVPEAFEDFDRRRLARAVRAEQREHGALLHVERDPVDGLDVRIVLLQIADVDDGLSHENASSRARQGTVPEYLLAEARNRASRPFRPDNLGTGLINPWAVNDVVRSANWRKARALFWSIITLIMLFALGLLAGAIAIPGLPSPHLDLSTFGPWVYAVPILIATKALLELLRPVFRAALKTHVKYESDIFAHFQIVSYIVWGTSIALVFYVLLGFGGSGQFTFLGTTFVAAALLYIMQEPLLNLVGWVVLVSMGLYKLGDRIEMNNSKGYVVEITPMNTTIREFGGALYGDSFTGRYVTIPHSQILKGNVYNYTKDTPFIWDQLVLNVTYESDLKLAERLIYEAAEEIVGPMMRDNRAHLRSKYEFADLADYMAEEPRVGWAFGASSIDLTLLYFCPVFAKGSYRTRLVKRIYEKVMAEPRVQFAYPHVQFVPQEPVEREKDAALVKEKLPVLR